MRSKFAVLLRQIDKRIRRISAAQMFWTIAMIDALLIVGVAALAFMPQAARFTLKAHTQRFSLEVPAGSSFGGWAKMTPEHLSGVDCRAPVLEMSRRLQGPFKLIVSSTASGDLEVEFHDAAPGALGSVRCGDQVTPLGKTLMMRFGALQVKSLALQFAGHLTLGADIPEGVNDPRLLLGGTVIAEAPGAAYQARTESELYPGDRVFLTLGNEKPAFSYGFFRVSDNGMDVVAHGNADTAQVVHHGQPSTAAATVAPSALARLQAHANWAIGLLIGGLLLHILSALRDYLFERARVEDHTHE